MRRVGWAYDWDRARSRRTIPTYYRWQQWQFLKFLERGLAYRKGAPVKWCPNDQTVLANEQVLDGRCERCGAEVESRLMEQWFFRITDYAQALLDDLETVDWPESIKARQRNWIGRSEGAEILFRIEELDEDIPVFTTRPDTLYGATFFVLAPEHELVARIDSDEVRDYVRRAAAKKTAERAAATEKTGVFTGLHAVNPVNGERLPVYVADYVLTDYGTGAIMAVPAHDQRDFDFATAFDLPIRQVVRPPDGERGRERRRTSSTPRARCSSTPASSTACPAPEGGRRIVEKLEAEGRGRLHDQLPPARLGLLAAALLGLPDPGRLLRHVRDRPGAGGRAAGRAPRDRGLQAEGRAAARAGRGLGERAVPALRRRRRSARPRRWTRSSTRPGTSCATATRTTTPRRSIAPPVDYWNPVDLYIGGVDHATMHMIYARFWVKVLNDLGMLGFREPFAQFFSNGWVTLGKTKMSKRAGNVVGPDDFVERYGADACRLNILFLGPADEDMEWTEASVEAMTRFVRRLWSVVDEVVESAPSGEPDGRRRSRGRRTRRSRRSRTTSAGASRSTRRSRR